MGNISINNFSTHQITLNNEDRLFIEKVNNRLTLYGQLPYTIPEKLIVEIIKESALYFYRMGYWRSQQTAFFRLPKKEIIEFMENAGKGSHINEPICEDYPDCDHQTHHIHPEEIGTKHGLDTRNIRGRGIKLPSYINAIRDIYQVNKDNYSQEEIFNSSAEYFYSNRASSYGSSLQGINQNLYIYEVTAKIQEQAVWQSVMGTSVPFTYNNTMHTLIIHKELAESDVSLMLYCECNVPIENLYVDDLFIKYVIGRCKQELRRMLGSHTFQLPGDVTINVDEICLNADTEVQSVEDTLKGGTGIGDLILIR